MEANLIRDVSGNILTLTTENSKESGYEVKMFEGKRINNFLEMNLRRVDGNNMYQYKTYTYESFESHFMKEIVDQKDIKEFIVTLINLCVAANEYLLCNDSIVLDVKYIFMDAGKYYFCYYPDNNVSFCDGLKTLMEFVLEHINHDNRENVMVAYGLYQKILKNNYTLESLMEVFEKNSNENKIKINLEYSQNVADELRVREEEEPYLYERNEKRERKEKKESKNLLDKIKQAFFRENKQKNNIESSATTEATMLLTALKMVSLDGEEDIIITHFPFVIGSNTKNCDFVMNNQMISRKHAIIWNDSGEYYLEDVGSTNGTSLNGNKIQICEKNLIEKGNIVEFANLRYRIE